MNRLGNFALFYAGWFGCVLLAAAKHPWWGAVAGLTCVALHIATAARRGDEARTIVALGAVGFLVDTAHAACGALGFPEQTSVWCPPWLVVIWMLFATTLNGAMSWLHGRYLLAAVVGAGFAPLSYLYGWRAGAITLPTAHAPLILAGTWAWLLPLMLWVHSKMTPRTAR